MVLFANAVRVDGRATAEVAAALGCVGHNHIDDVPLIPALTLVAREEKRPAFQNRTAQRGAELIPLEVLLLRGEEVLRVECVVPQELECAAAEGVRSRLRDGVERAAGAMALGGIGVLLDAEFLQRIDRRLDPGAALMLLGDVDAVEQEARLLPADAADDVAVHDFRPHRLHVARRRQERRARCQLRELVKAAAVERQVDDLFVGDDVAERRRFGVQQRGLCGDEDISRQRTHRECQLHACRLPDGQLHAIADGRLKPWQRRADAIEAGLERRDNVVAFAVGRDRARDVGRGIRHRDGRAWNGGVLFIEHGPE